MGQYEPQLLLSWSSCVGDVRRCCVGSMFCGGVGSILLCGGIYPSMWYGIYMYASWYGGMYLCFSVVTCISL